MGNIIVNDNNKYITANQLVTADLLGREQTQRLNNDWVRMLTSFFIYSADNQIATVGFDATTYFQIGDIIHIYQNSIDKYFYVISVTESIIYVYAGTDYTFDNTAIQIIEFSRLANPFGFPLSFNFSSTLRGVSPTTIPDQGIFEGTFSMIRNIVTAYYSRSVFQIATATTSGLYEELPVGRDIMATASGSYQNGITNIRIATGPFMDPLLVEITKWDFTNFAIAASQSMLFGITYTILPT